MSKFFIIITYLSIKSDNHKNGYKSDRGWGIAIVVRWSKRHNVVFYRSRRHLKNKYKRSGILWVNFSFNLR